MTNNIHKTIGAKTIEETIQRIEMLIIYNKFKNKDMISESEEKQLTIALNQLTSALKIINNLDR